MKRIAVKQISCFAVVAAVLVFLPFSLGAYVKDQDATASREVTKEKQKKKTEQEDKAEGKIAKEHVIHNEIVVTATRTEKTVLNVPQPVSVVNLEKIVELAPNNISDVLPELPGTDVVGVGANQSRPIIRGLRGQRILLLSDGIRLSNSRRTQDFGEIPAMVDVFGLDRVEVVRGPASVLYGSEAIGGVINMITREPNFNLGGSSIVGNIGYRYSSADSQNKGFANINGNLGNLSFMLSGTFRNSKEYSAPAGTFGDITLKQDTPVLDSGVQDSGFNVFLGYRLAEKNDISVKYEYYNANDAGFGYIDPAEYAPGDPVIQLLYPDQKMRKLTLKFENRSLNFALADGISLTGYNSGNKRTFDTNIGITFFPGAGMNISSSNFTDVTTWGARFELTKVVFNGHILTYGADFFQDDSENTDYSSTEMYFFGTPSTSVDTTPNLPNAFLQSYGIFIQDDIRLFSKSTLVLGVRYQNVNAETKTTPGLDEPLVNSTDSTLVGAANFLFGVTDNFKLILSMGRGFRSPNLPERFFHGVTPDGSGYQIRNTELKPETSFNLDLGFRFNLNNFYIESTYFRNTLSDGIQIAGTGGTFAGLPEWKNVNIDKLRLHGFEMLSQFLFDFGLSLRGDFSYVASKNLSNPEIPYSDTYGSRLNLNIRYAFPENRLWIEYHVRYHGDQKNVELLDNPIGNIIPGFTVHSLRAGVTLFKKSGFPQQIGVIIGNLTNTLYSEFSNASFFRPAPKRHVVLTWSARF
ncbi:MAG: TonB-dependent receptor [Candidatus Aminicenantes bacterium]|nr:TonB-dependent receptor [Candidatus Aminicenantes bacterium]